MGAVDGAAWRKSSRSGSHGNCVELAGAPGVVAVRDGKNPDAGHLRISRRGFAVLLNEVKAGRHDL
ncbi:DUF397 domain-containing protein [Thermomonospora catenispora]|uniref:DUF397 domain-containing protein n=1 Tax=Thermomonospora catenispora TaxID=2493090 RepID=UPI00111F3EA5|nr:DUF397 domain-containing protein [Thermomonospora catenispora]TNY38705.1 DUF397 domain-containing protein [Thermomonospora catenispora]